MPDLLKPAGRDRLGEYLDVFEAPSETPGSPIAYDILGETASNIRWYDLGEECGAEDDAERQIGEVERTEVR